MDIHLEIQNDAARSGRKSTYKIVAYDYNDQEKVLVPNTTTVENSVKMTSYELNCSNYKYIKVMHINSSSSNVSLYFNYYWK